MNRVQEGAIMHQRADTRVGRRRALGPRLVAVGLVVISLAAGWSAAPSGAAVGPRRFESLEDATGAFISALKAGDQKALVSIFGTDTRGLLSSGDAVADKRAREQFVTAYDEQHRLEGGGGKVVLIVGKEDFPFPIPLVPDGPVWRWDTNAGREEIINRRVGRNELHTIQVALAYVDAQREYYARDPDKNGLLQYARKFVSAPGKRDGLYWDAQPGEPPSPLGLLVAQARSEGYSKKDGPIAYWGYYFRILTAQGKDAPGGAYDYLAKGNMIGGFALVAYPAQWGSSGVMTFIVNQDGVVYEKNLGPNTPAMARAMKQFNPDSTWKKSASADDVATAADGRTSGAAAETTRLAQAPGGGDKSAPAEPKVTGKGAVGAVRVRGTIAAVDKDQGTVTLKGPKGRTLTVEVRDKSKLDAVAVGDPVVADYVEALVVQVKKSGTAAPGTTTQETHVSSKPGETPGGAIGREVTITSTITAVDKKAHTVTVKGPEGRTETIKAKDPKNLEGIKAGDLVEITYTQALAISLDKPAK